MPTCACNILKRYITELLLAFCGISFFFFFELVIQVNKQGEFQAQDSETKFTESTRKSKQKLHLFLNKKHFSSKKITSFKEAPVYLLQFILHIPKLQSRTVNNIKNSFFSSLPLQVFRKFKQCPGHFCSCDYPKISKAFFFLPASHLTLHHPILITFDQQEADTMD